MTPSSVGSFFDYTNTNKITPQQHLNISTFQLSPEIVFTLSRERKFTDLYHACKVNTFTRQKAIVCRVRRGCLLCVMCSGVGSCWSLRSLVIKVIKDFESVKLCLYNYIFLIYNYIESDLHFFLKMTLMTNDLNDP